MAITAKPTSYSVNTGHAKCPKHLWMLDENTGTTCSDKGSGTALNITLDNSGMWGSDALGITVNPSTASAWKGLSATGTIWNTTSGNVLLVALFKGSSGYTPASDEYIFGYGNSADNTAFGGIRTLSATQNMNGYADDGPDTVTQKQFLTQDLYDDSWHMLAVKIQSGTSQVNLGSSVDGAAWQNAASSTLTGGTINRYGLGCRPSQTGFTTTTGQLLAMWAYEDATYSSWDDAWISNLYSDPWQFLNTGHPARSRTRGIPGMNDIRSRLGRGW